MVTAEDVACFCGLHRWRQAPQRVQGAHLTGERWCINCERHERGKFDPVFDLWEWTVVRKPGNDKHAL